MKRQIACFADANTKKPKVSDSIRKIPKPFKEQKFGTLNVAENKEPF
jgi:hypothetical protein